VKFSLRTRAGLVSGAESLEQSGEHSLYLKEFSFGFAMPLRAHHLQIACEQKKVLEFTCRTHRDMQKLAKFRTSSASAAFRYIGRNRTGCPSELAAKSETLLRRKFASNSIDIKHEIMTASPNIELAKVLHLVVSGKPARCASIYLQLNTKYCQLVQ